MYRSRLLVHVPLVTCTHEKARDHTRARDSQPDAEQRGRAYACSVPTVHTNTSTCLWPDAEQYGADEAAVAVADTAPHLIKSFNAQSCYNTSVRCFHRMRGLSTL